MTGTPLVVAQAVARNVVPLAGILFLGWNAAAVLVLYFVDTMLALAVLFAGVLRYFAPPIENDGWAARLNGEAGVIGGAAFVALVLAIPLGLPLLFVLGDAIAWRTLLDDPAFRGGLVAQVIAALWSYVELWRAMRAGNVEALQLKRRFSLVLLRWLALVVIAYTGVGLLLGRLGALFFVAAYAAISIVAEIAPDRFLRYMQKAEGPPAAEPAPARSRRAPRKAARR